MGNLRSVQQAETIKQDRGWLHQQLAGMKGVQVFPSAANFILFRVAHAAEVFEGLKQRGILIKKLHGSHPALENSLRVTVGTAEQNKQFIAALRNTS
jgi:histidinol-phosphate aminotransferase